MQIKKSIFCLSLLMISVFAMKKEAVLRDLSFRFQQLEKLKEKLPELKNQLDQRKNKKRDMISKTVQGYPYEGPQVFDIINSNIYVTSKQFALSDQDEYATDLYQAQNPFGKLVSLKGQGIPFGVSSLVVNKQDQLATDSGNQVIVWDLQTYEQIATLKGHIDIVSSLDFDPKNPHLLVSGSYDTTIKVWDLRDSSRCIATLPDTDKIYSVSFSPNVEQLVSVNASNKNALGLWFLINKQKVATASGSWTAKYNHAGQTIIAGLPGEIVLYNQGLEKLQSLELPGEWSKNGAIPGAFDFSSNNSKVVVSGPLQDIFVCKGDLSEIELDITSGMVGVDSHFNPSGTQILSSAYGCAVDTGSYVRIWDLEAIRETIKSGQQNKNNGSNTPAVEERIGCKLQ